MAYASLTPRAIRSGMNYSILNSAVSSMAAVFCGGAVLSGMLLTLNFTHVEIGILMSIPMFCLPLQMAGALLQQRFFNRKRFWVVCGVIHYLGYFAIAALVGCWLHLPSETGVVIFMSIFAAIYMVVQLPASIWLSWMSDVVPPRESNGFWTRRQAVMLLICSGTFLAAGWMADRLGNAKLSTYVILPSIGAVLGILCVFFQAKVPDVPPRSRRQPAFVTQLRVIWHNRQQRTLILFFALQSLVQNFSVPFIYIYMKSTKPGDGMGYSLLLIQCLFATANAVGFFSGYFFRPAADRYGRKPVLIFCYALKVVEFCLYGILIPRTGLWVAIPLFSLGGFVNMGIAVCQMSLLSSTGSRRIQGVAVGLFYGLTGLFSFAGSFASGYLYDWIAQWRPGLNIPVLMELSPFNILSLLTAFLLIFTIPVFLSFRERGAGTTRTLVRNLFSTANPIRAIYYAYAINRPQTERRRVDLLQKAEGDLVTLALLNDLSSPSSEVRETTLAALARSRNELSDTVIRELYHLLHTPELGNQVSAAKTLGRHQVSAAAEELANFFLDPDLAVAQACISAAGCIGNPAVVPQLVAVLKNARVEPRWPAAAEVLGKLDGFHSTRLLFRVYFTEHNWVLRRQSLIALCRTVGDAPETVFPDFESEEKSSGQTLELRLKPLLAKLGGQQTMESLLAEYDRMRYAAVLEKILLPVLKDRGIAAAPGRLGELFRPGGAQLRNEEFNRDTYESTVLWLAMQFWYELAYAEHPDPVLLPAAIFGLTGLVH